MSYNSGPSARGYPSSHWSDPYGPISLRPHMMSMFVPLIMATIIYLPAFTTTTWSVHENAYTGLWRECNCTTYVERPSWFIGVQLTTSITMIFLLLSLLLLFAYICLVIARHPAGSPVLISLIVMEVLATASLSVALLIYGIKAETLSLSYGLALLTSLLTFLSIVVSFLQFQGSGVRIQPCFSLEA